MMFLNFFSKIITPYKTNNVEVTERALDQSKKIFNQYHPNWQVQGLEKISVTNINQKSSHRIHSINQQEIRKIHSTLVHPPECSKLLSLILSTLVHSPENSKLLSSIRINTKL